MNISQHIVGSNCSNLKCYWNRRCIECNLVIFIKKKKKSTKQQGIFWVTNTEPSLWNSAYKTKKTFNSLLWKHFECNEAMFVIQVFLASIRGVLGWLWDPWSVYGWSLPLWGGLDGRRLWPARLQPTLYQTRHLQGWEVPVSPGLERRALHHW